MRRVTLCSMLIAAAAVTACSGPSLPRLSLLSAVAPAGTPALTTPIALPSPTLDRGVAALTAAADRPASALVVAVEVALQAAVVPLAVPAPLLRSVSHRSASLVRADQSQIPARQPPRARVTARRQ